MEILRTNKLILEIILVITMVAGCSALARVDSVRNTQPSEPFVNFGHFQLFPVELDPSLGAEKSNREALSLMQQHLNEGVSPRIDGWNKKRAGNPDRTLEIHPHIDDVRLVSENMRFWAQSLAGNSRLLLRVTILEKDSHRIIAEPIFTANVSSTLNLPTEKGMDQEIFSSVSSNLISYLMKYYWPNGFSDSQGPRSNSITFKPGR